MREREMGVGFEKHQVYNTLCQTNSPLTFKFALLKVVVVRKRKLLG
jgi:hypothetical protein